MSRLPAVAAAMALLIGCGQGHLASHGSPAGQAVAKVRVYTDGRVTLDGKPVTTDELKAAFAELKSRNGVVWYFREQGAGAFHPTARRVMEAVMQARLPISLSDREDFSTVGTVNGGASSK
jgi:hypothetical protein